MITTNNLKLPEEKDEGKKLRVFTTNKIRDEVKDQAIGEIRGPTLYKGKIIQAGRPLVNEERPIVKRTPIPPPRPMPERVVIKRKAIIAGADTHGDVKTIKIADQVPGTIIEPINAEEVIKTEDAEDLTAPPKAAEPYVAEDPPAPEVVKAKKKPGPKVGTKRAKRT